MQQNKKLLNRLGLLLIFATLIFGIFLMARSLANPQEENNLEKVTDEGFLPSENGKAVLVEFSDFQCPACGIYYPLVKKLKTDLGDKLTVVYKHFPLSQIHKNADLAARTAEAAKIQGKFWEMHDMIFEKQNEWSGSNQALSLFSSYAVSLGLDKDKFLQDIDSNEVRNKISDDYQQGVRLGVKGTPTFFLNGKKITNPGNYDDFKSTIEQSIEQ